MIKEGMKVIVTREFRQDNFMFEIGDSGKVLIVSKYAGGDIRRILVEWDFESECFHDGRSSMINGKPNRCYYIDGCYVLENLEYKAFKKNNMEVFM